MPDEKNDLLPKWAVALTVQVAELNAKLGPHTDWVERSVKDHEVRLRQIEAGKAGNAALKLLEGRVDDLAKEHHKNSWLPKIAWVVVTAVATYLVTTYLK